MECCSVDRGALKIREEDFTYPPPQVSIIQRVWLPETMQFWESVHFFSFVVANIQNVLVRAAIMTGLSCCCNIRYSLRS